MNDAGRQPKANRRPVPPVIHRRARCLRMRRRTHAPVDNWLPRHDYGVHQTGTGPVAEKLDHQPGVFTVERHIRGKWACAGCQTLTQAPVPAHIIDKGIPTTGLLAQVRVVKYADYVPLYRQERIFERAGLGLPRSTLAQWVGACGVQLQPLVDALQIDMLGHAVLHADETPVAMLAPGTGKTLRAYLWSYCTGA